MKRNYIARMLRRLLTCLAIMTGLAASGAPVTTLAAEAASEQVASGTCQSDSGKDQRCDCEQRKTAPPLGKKKSSGCKPRKPIIVYLPPLYLGADRALE